MTIRPKYGPRAHALDQALMQFAQEIRPLPGIATHQCRGVLVAQMIESLRRTEYAEAIRARDASADRAEPRSLYFDPERGALWHASQGNLDEALWLIFLATACGKHGQDGWRLARDIYGKIGSNRDYWDWKAVRDGPTDFRQWLADNEARFAGDGVGRRFGNHRKYANRIQTGAAVETYVAWVAGFGGPGPMLQAALEASGHDPRATFDFLYKSMLRAVKHFGRLGCFDFLTMIGKLQLAPIEPGSTYMKGATGPFAGANLLFWGDAAGNLTATQLDAWLVDLDSFLHVGMQVLEDSLCNWQKSPAEFKSFRG